MDQDIATAIAIAVAAPFLAFIVISPILGSQGRPLLMLGAAAVLLGAAVLTVFSLEWWPEFCEACASSRRWRVVAAAGLLPAALVVSYVGRERYLRAGISLLVTAGVYGTWWLYHTE